MTSTEKYETFGKRFLAGIVDTIVFVPLILFQNYYEDRDDTNGLVFANILMLVCWMFYVVIGHGKYGQTVGKKVMGIKVFKLNETEVIGYKRAFYRETVWFAAESVAIILFIISINNNINYSNLDAAYEGSYVGLFSTIWFVLELVTMLFNPKRRALHDYIAGSVVVDLNELKREQLQAQHTEMIAPV